MSCDVQDLLDAAKCLSDCTTEADLEAIGTYLLCEWANK